MNKAKIAIKKFQNSKVVTSDFNESTISSPLIHYLKGNKQKKEGNQMEQLKIFNFENSEVRTHVVDGNPWFVGKDVAEILGYTNTPKAIRDHVEEEDKLSERIVLSGQARETIVINESGLYSLVLKSKLPSAKRFKRWVTDEVLPSIRKHGAYATENVLEQAIGNPDFMIGLLSSLKSEQEARKKAEQIIEAQRPKALVGEMLEVSQNSVSVKKLATILKQNGFNTGQNRLFDWMRENGYLITRYGSSRNMPTQKAMDLGLFELKPASYFRNSGILETDYTPMVTGKGQAYFLRKFKELEVLNKQEKMEV
jgi:anti-repressor protein